MPAKKKKTKRRRTSKSAGKKKTARKAVGSAKKQNRKRKRARKKKGTAPQAFLPEQLQARAGEQSGDLQGLSRRQGADSESVAELLEEGNAFEADAVTGVEEAGDAEGREVHTREVPEDDIPGEYLDKD